ncbi:hypothetical protein FOA52_006600 [Chlamydomonas sp. UWO 241]|nr:hypothetical protein FOA52_006600 [Chlamydomonas sp. UWO 241]
MDEDGVDAGWMHLDSLGHIVLRLDPSSVRALLLTCRAAQCAAHDADLQSRYLLRRYASRALIHGTRGGATPGTVQRLLSSSTPADPDRPARLARAVEPGTLRTPLHLACARGDAPSAASLLLSGAPTQLLDGNRDTSLHLAAGAPEEPERRGWGDRGAPLRMAAGARDEPLPSAATPLDGAPPTQLLDGHRDTPLHLAAGAPEEPERRGWGDRGAPLRMAAGARDEPLPSAAAPLDGAPPTRLLDKNRDTPLHLAAGAPDEPERRGWGDRGAPLRMAAGAPDELLPSAATLLDGAPPTQLLDQNRDTPLHLAAGAPDEPARRGWGDRGAPLCMAAGAPDEPLHVEGAPEPEPPHGDGAGDSGGVGVGGGGGAGGGGAGSGGGGALATCSVLLKSWLATDSITYKNKQGRTPLHIACQVGRTHAAQRLLTACCCLLLPNTTGAGCCLPTSACCAQAGRTRVAERLLSARGIEATSTCNIGWMALHYACAGGHLETVGVLLQHHGYRDKRAALGDYTSPLALAAECGHLSTVALLLASPGIDVNARTPTKSPPHVALSKGHFEVAGRLARAEGAVVWLETLRLAVAVLPRGGTLLGTSATSHSLGHLRPCPKITP